MTTFSDELDPARTALPAARTSGAPTSDLVRSVSRALAVLEVVGRAGNPVSVKAVARRTGLNLSTTYHLMRTLTWEGYLSRLPNGDYRLGAGVAHRYQELRTAIAAPPDVRTVLLRLVVATGWTAFAGCAVEGDAVLIDVVEGPGTPHLPLLVPGSPGGVRLTPLAALLGTDDDGPVSMPAPFRRAVETGRLHQDVVCAAIAVRRSYPGSDRSEQLWAVGLAAPRSGLDPAGPFPGALVRAADRISGRS